MDLRILWVLLIYYGLLSLVILFPGSPLLHTQSNNLPSFNNSALAPNEKPDAGLFATGVSFGRFAQFITTGTGLPSDTPIGLQIIIGVWQSMVTVFSVGWFISAIWNG